MSFTNYVYREIDFPRVNCYSDGNEKSSCIDIQVRHVKLLISLMKNQSLMQQLFTQIAEVWTNILAFLGQAWWVEVFTAQPQCTYYFGPFVDARTASLATTGYVEDLEGEFAQGIETQIKRCKPDRLTIDPEESGMV
jgi:hypothetical protein